MGVCYRSLDMGQEASAEPWLRRSGVLSYLVLGLHYPRQIWCTIYLGGLLDLRFLLEEEVAGMARRAFVQICVGRQLHPFLGLWGPVCSHSCLVGLLPCALHCLEEYLEAATSTESSIMDNSEGPRGGSRVSLLLHGLHRLPICFWVQCKMLVITF